MSRLVSTRVRLFVVLLILCSLSSLTALAQDAAAPDSTYFTLEAEGASIGWMSLKKSTVDSGNAVYSGHGVFQGTTSIWWRLELTGDLTRLISMENRMKMPERLVTSKSVFKERGGEPDFEVVVDGTRWPQPVEEVKAGAVLVPSVVAAAIAPLSDRLAGEDPKGLDIKLHATNGVQALVLQVTGSAKSRVEVRGEEVPVRTFELAVTHTSEPEPTKMSLYQRPDGSFFGLETGGMRMFATGGAAESGPMPRVYPAAVTSEAGELPGALTLPPEGDEPAGPQPAVLMIAGPSQVGMDAQSAGFRLFAHLAHGLAEGGVASLRYTPRDLTAGGPDVMTHLVADAEAAFAVLSAREGIDPAKILLVGHGEGAMLLGELSAKLAAAGTPVRGLIYLGGVTVPGAELHAEVPRPEDAPWLESFLAYDPRAHLAGELPPLLVMHGGLDTEVPASNAEGLKAFLNEAGHMRISLNVGKTLNHYLQSAETGSAEEYETLPPACAAGIVKRISKFVGFCVR